MATAVAIDDGTRQKKTMMAIVQDTYASADLLQLREIDRPVVGDDEVLVRVRYAEVDQGLSPPMSPRRRPALPVRDGQSDRPQSLSYV
jgi:hypothetical protein